jgi:hypothetical protein
MRAALQMEVLCPCSHRVGAQDAGQREAGLLAEQGLWNGSCWGKRAGPCAVVP